MKDITKNIEIEDRSKSHKYVVMNYIHHDRTTITKLEILAIFDEIEFQMRTYLTDRSLYDQVVKSNQFVFPDNSSNPTKIKFEMLVTLG